MAEHETIRIAACIAAGACMGIGTLGPSIGLGLIGARACESLGKAPESADALRGIMFLGLIFVESVVIYAFVISLILLFVVK